MKTCKRCGGEFPETNFYKQRGGRGGKSAKCKQCADKETKAWRERNLDRWNTYQRTRRQRRPEVYMYTMSKCRAKGRGLEFSIQLSDVQVPEKCPLLGLTLKFNEGRLGPDSPTLDRIDSSLGYIPGNVWVISHRANTIKNDATLEELETIARKWRGLVP